MKLAKLASLLYPRWWRERYGQEFAALLDDTRPGLAGAFDIAKGALTMQLTTWSPTRTMLACLTLGLIASAAVLGAWPKTFVSTAVIQVVGNESPQEVATKVNRVGNMVLSRISIAGIVEKFRLQEDLDPAAAIEDFRRKTSIRPLPVWVSGQPSPAFEIAWEHPDRFKAQRVANEISVRFLNNGNRGLALLDPATLPEIPNRPSAAKVFGIGMLASIAIGGLLALFLMWKRLKRAA